LHRIASRLAICAHSENHTPPISAERATIDDLSKESSKVQDSVLFHQSQQHANHNRKSPCLLGKDSAHINTNTSISGHHTLTATTGAVPNYSPDSHSNYDEYPGRRPKRITLDVDGDSCSDGSNQRPLKHIKKENLPTSPDIKLACPYQKNDPNNFNSQSERVCRRSFWPSTARIKQVNSFQITEYSV
jgi:hypothetical protein